VNTLADKKKICVITGSRSEYGILRPVLEEIRKSSKLILQILTTGSHLSPEYGLTYKEIENDGFTINEKVDILLSSNTKEGVCKSMGLALIGISSALVRLEPDLVLLLGDRYEILAAAETALTLRIPIAHIAGGDTTEGAIDESYRHAISKMANLHFVTNEDAAHRLKQLGENPEFIYNVGSPAIDNIKNVIKLKKPELEKTLDFEFKKINFLVTYHPVTASERNIEKSLNELLSALDEFKEEGIIFTYPNADNDSRIIISIIEEFTKTHKNAKFFTSLGMINYLSAIQICDVVIGNSSSGLYEVPSFNKWTVNIGARQKGRIRASSILDVDENANSISAAIHYALNNTLQDVKNPYGNGFASKKIVEQIEKLDDFNTTLNNHFFLYNLEPWEELT
jgi:UDP-N-acetylglucosamine 2-epimerase (non-hydrolysing)/GDP/UDP-N,N'-diacetylbacillosamine 2-epimerase (hydrolysing)